MALKGHKYVIDTAGVTKSHKLVIDTVGVTESYKLVIDTAGVTKSHTLVIDTAHAGKAKNLLMIPSSNVNNAACNLTISYLIKVYTIFRKDRPSRGGGVLLAVNNTIPCQLISSPSNLEVVCIKLNLSHPITCCVLYNPPNLLSEYCDNLLNFISNISNSSDRLILLGDFNLPDINWNVLSGNSPVSNKLCDLIFHSGMNQLIDKPIPTYMEMCWTCF